MEKCYSEVTSCRVCGSTKLKKVFSLGEQFLTGVFPREGASDPAKGPVDLTFCQECHLLQLKQSYSLSEMYGDNYGYRSGLNKSMVDHLQSKIKKLEKFVNLKAEDLVIDIGSNDATSLKGYSVGCNRVGIDPTSKKFQEYYTDGIRNIPDFFSKEVFFANFPEKEAKIVTSIAMFYDLESPISFAKDVEAVLAEDGIWHFEQSYMPSMLKANAYDTVCHEHLEFYSLENIIYILKAAHMRVIDVELNDINGGSFAITACKEHACYKGNKNVIDDLLNEEKTMGINRVETYENFSNNIKHHAKELKELLVDITKNHKVFGYGASTKGNVLLQYCGIGTDIMPYIVEVNEEKFGAMTPGTHIPIISEEDGEKLKPDYYLVLPWHFKDNILPRVGKMLDRGAKFIFPLPDIQIIGRDDYR